MTSNLNRSVIAAMASAALLMTGISAIAQNKSGTTSGPATGTTAAPNATSSSTSGTDHPTAENGASVGSPGTAGQAGNKNGPPAKKPHQ